MDLCCKHCKSKNFVKSWKIRWKQRYRCKECKTNFIEWDQRIKPSLESKKALAVILYTMWWTSYRFIWKTIWVCHTLVYRWIKEKWLLKHKETKDKKIDENIEEIEFDEMWHFIDKKKVNFGL